MFHFFSLLLFLAPLEASDEAFLDVRFVFGPTGMGFLPHESAESEPSSSSPNSAVFEWKFMGTRVTWSGRGTNVLPSRLINLHNLNPIEDAFGPQFGNHELSGSIVFTQGSDFVSVVISASGRRHSPVWGYSGEYSFHNQIAVRARFVTGTWSHLVEGENFDLQITNPDHNRLVLEFLTASTRFFLRQHLVHNLPFSIGEGTHSEVMTNEHARIRRNNTIDGISPKSVMIFSGLFSVHETIPLVPKSHHSSSHGLGIGPYDNMYR